MGPAERHFPALLRGVAVGCLRVRMAQQDGHGIGPSPPALLPQVSPHAYVKGVQKVNKSPGCNFSGAAAKHRAAGRGGKAGRVLPLQWRSISKLVKPPPFFSPFSHPNTRTHLLPLSHLPTHP